MLFRVDSYAYFYIALIWTVTTLYLSLVSAKTLSSMHFWNLPGLDKIAHTVFYIVFSFLWCMTISRKKNRMLMVIIFAISFGVAMETGQYWMRSGRAFEVLDIIVNTAGAIIGSGIFRWMQSIQTGHN